MVSKLQDTQKFCTTEVSPFIADEIRKWSSH
jgi:hypothetical protein